MNFHYFSQDIGVLAPLPKATLQALATGKAKLIPKLQPHKAAPGYYWHWEEATQTWYHIQAKSAFFSPENMRYYRI